jgi:asparagine synthase (glutamine-hydrolysing)
VCGIAGFTHKDRAVDPSRFRAILRSIEHRGPDQQGVYESAHVSLGAVRLKIIDLEGGDQPITSDDGDTTIVFNGEIYNHAELREELRALGHRFHSRCDTEVVLHAFLEWGRDCFARLRGMFGVALWSESQRRLVLARDRVGIKPLYAKRVGRDLYFGSEMKTILLHPEVDRKLDLTGLNYYLSLNYVPGWRTLIEGIRKVPPGHWLEWRDGMVALGPYWKPSFETRARSLGEAKEELDGLLRSSVREHMVSDVPLGVWASGGLDSSAILHYAASETSARLKTFSVSFRGRSFDESGYFRQVAEKYGTDHHEFDLNPEQDLAGTVERMVYHSDEPSADAGALPVWFLSEMSRRHVTVALSGEGADELFGGYLTYRADAYARLACLAPKALRKLALRMFRHLPLSNEKIGLEYKLKRFLEGSLLAPDVAHCYWNGTFSPDERQSFFQGAAPDGLRRLYNALPSSAAPGSLNRYLAFDQRYYLPDDILAKCDRMSMAHALEVRPPFLDHRIVEYAASLPENLKIRGSNQKFVLRELMRDKLPRAVLKRKKEGFDIPTHDWLRGVLKPLLTDTLSPEAVRATEIFDAGRVENMVRDHLGRRANLGFHLWGLLILFLWMRRWNVQAASETVEAEASLQAAGSAIS